MPMSSNVKFKVMNGFEVKQIVNNELNTA